jgi:hypothetical protein
MANPVNVLISAACSGAAALIKADRPAALAFLQNEGVTLEKAAETTLDSAIDSAVGKNVLLKAFAGTIKSGVNSGIEALVAQAGSREDALLNLAEAWFEAEAARLAA